MVVRRREFGDRGEDAANSVVEAPVVFEENDFGIRRQAHLGVAVEESGEVAEIRSIPIEYPAQGSGVGREAVGRGIVDKKPGSGIEPGIEVSTLKSAVGQGGAGFGSTVQGEMDPGIPEPGAEDIIFDLVQGISP